MIKKIRIIIGFVIFGGVLAAGGGLAMARIDGYETDYFLLYFVGLLVLAVLPSSIGLLRAALTSRTDPKRRQRGRRVKPRG